MQDFNRCAQRLALPLVLFESCISVCVEGANVYAKSRTGATALTEAASNGHTQIVHLLNRHIMSAKSQLGIIMLCLSLCPMSMLSSSAR